MKRDYFYFCNNCKDRGVIYRFLWLIATECPACHGDPKKAFRKEHPIPHMPPEKTHASKGNSR